MLCQTLFILALWGTAAHALGRMVSQHALNIGDDIMSTTDQSTLLDRKVRITEPTLCEDRVKQYSGYVDITSSKHLFFWFFESRHAPKTAPLVLWLNGGPGSSSLVSGLLYENGACLFSPETNSTVVNPYSWNEHANILYLDQPVGAGYSYFTGPDDQVKTLEPLAADVYAFLQLFLARFPEYARAPLHLVGESFGGHFLPHIGSYIHRKNDEMIYAPRPGQIRVNLESLVIVNGLTEPYSQLATTADYLCGGAPYPPFEPDSARCGVLRTATPPCLGLIEACYKFDNTAACAPASAYCYPALLQALIGTDIHPHDVRRRCIDGNCFPELDTIVDWLNLPDVKRQLGANPDKNTSIVDWRIYTPFYLEGQELRNSAALLPPLIKDGIRVLAFAGEMDSVCHYIGVERWMTRLEHALSAELQSAPLKPWKIETSKGPVGEIRQAGPGAGNYTYARVYNAGHMAPHDQPEASLDLVVRWLKNKPFL